MAEQAQQRSDPDGRAAGPPERESTPRTCAVCGTKLSRYNSGPNCWQHTIGCPWRGPTARPKYDRP